MSAFIIIEMEVRNPEAKDRYSRAAAPLLQQSGGEFIAAGPWTTLAGESGLKYGAIIRFENRERALAWYDSPAYQNLLHDREAGMDCRFQLIG